MRKVALTAVLFAFTMSTASANDEEWAFVSKREGRNGFSTYILPSSINHTYVTFLEVKDVYPSLSRYDYAWAVWEVNCDDGEMTQPFGAIVYFKNERPREVPGLEIKVTPSSSRYELFNYICSLREERFRQEEEELDKLLED
ncbi:MAG: hypothetical protein JJ947_11160 [Altererythrobacter sp.]|uniref:hypothetical protein n=1 Tax=Altererythrobacter sp. TaxID=1872480 RepID=UPI001B2D7E72|nr:hypothetical protein [Altererythrobacter sp.]MBO6642789.1 hypothetical protein [Altererythrobacter sp.]MBO6708703.1 hypothetical protein [Altererythrobacter sp.]